MKKNLLCLFVLMCSVSLFTACSDDEPKNAGPDYPMLQDATVGTYDGGSGGNDGDQGENPLG